MFYLSGRVSAMNNFFIYFLLWFPLVVIAIINGAIREKYYRIFLGDLSAHQLSVVSGISLFAIYFWFISGQWQLDSALQTLQVGVMWLAMTIVFEFVFGHFVMKHSWQKLFADYNILKGRLWLVVLIWTTFGLYIFYSITN